MVKAGVGEIWHSISLGSPVAITSMTRGGFFLEIYRGITHESFYYSFVGNPDAGGIATHNTRCGRWIVSAELFNSTNDN